MYIALVLPHLASSGGATYRHSYAAPPELARCGRTSAIYIPRLWRSGPITLIPMTLYLPTLQLSEEMQIFVTPKAPQSQDMLTHLKNAIGTAPVESKEGPKKAGRWGR
jgi:hypothetical protein